MWHTARADALAYLPGEVVVDIVQDGIEVVSVKPAEIHGGRRGNCDLTSMMETNSPNLIKSNSSAALEKSKR
jgi:hypothetical protein